MPALRMSVYVWCCCVVYLGRDLPRPRLSTNMLALSCFAIFQYDKSL